MFDNMIGTCRLCLKENRELKDSHLLPRALYKHMVHSDGGYVSVTSKHAKKNGKQIQDYLLCNECETRFNKGGEEWVLANYAKTKQKFPLRDILLKSTPLAVIDSRAAYNAAVIKEIDINKLIYFAISVFWRMAAHQWHFGGGITNKLVLGKYEEPLRLFLMDGVALPKEVALHIMVSPSQNPQMWSSSPHRVLTQPCHGYGFCISGIVFMLLVGQGIPAVAYEGCAIKNNIVLLTKDADTLAAREGRKLAAKYRNTKRILK